MIVLGNDLFATGMRLAGLKESHVVKKREEALGLIRSVPKDEMILANVSVIKLAPELEEFKNLVSIPDDPAEFGSTEDLKRVIRLAVGFDINV